MSKVEDQIALQEQLKQFFAKGNEVTVCIPAIAQGAQMSKRARKSANTARADFRKDQKDV